MSLSAGGSSSSSGRTSSFYARKTRAHVARYLNAYKHSLVGCLLHLLSADVAAFFHVGATGWSGKSRPFTAEGATAAFADFVLSGDAIAEGLDDKGAQKLEEQKAIVSKQCKNSYIKRNLHGFLNQMSGKAQQKERRLEVLRKRKEAAFVAEKQKVTPRT